MYENRSIIPMRRVYRADNSHQEEDGTLILSPPEYFPLAHLMNEDGSSTPLMFNSRTGQLVFEPAAEYRSI